MAMARNIRELLACGDTMFISALGIGVSCILQGVVYSWDKSIVLLVFTSMKGVCLNGHIVHIDSYDHFV